MIWKDPFCLQMIMPCVHRVTKFDGKVKVRNVPYSDDETQGENGFSRTENPMFLLVLPRGLQPPCKSQGLPIF